MTFHDFNNVIDILLSLVILSLNGCHSVAGLLEYSKKTALLFCSIEILKLSYNSGQKLTDFTQILILNTSKCCL